MRMCSQFLIGGLLERVCVNTAFFGLTRFHAKRLKETTVFAMGRRS